MNKRSLIAGVVTTLVLGVLMVAPAAAKDKGPDSATSVRPGWGYGDTNHEHSGPPGKTGNHHDNGKGND